MISKEKIRKDFMNGDLDYILAIQQLEKIGYTYHAAEEMVIGWGDGEDATPRGYIPFED